MRVVFMGTPDFAVPSLKKLAHDHQVAWLLQGQMPFAVVVKRLSHLP